MEKISMLEIRRNARALIERLLQGESFTITYRNRAVAELHPVRGEPADLAGDPIYEIADLAEDLGTTLDAREADALLYGGTKA
jgi:antitoxin (DNA-binding transcriptional repressor) of toxin-antitoxin stability system